MPRTASEGLGSSLAWSRAHGQAPRRRSTSTHRGQGRRGVRCAAPLLLLAVWIGGVEADTLGFSVRYKGELLWI